MSNKENSSTGRYKKLFPLTLISVFIILLLTTSGAILMASSSIIKVLAENNAFLIPSIIGVSIAIGSIVAITKYLGPKDDVDNYNVKGNGKLIDLFRRVALFVFTVFFSSISISIKDDDDEKMGGGIRKKNADHSILSDEEKREITYSIQKGVEERLILEANKELVNKIKTNSIEDYFYMVNKRLKDESINQSKRGALNLGIGAVIAFIGVVFLFYSVIYNPIQGDMVKILFNFLPKLSLVILVEVFAYFFLRLYKNSLDEIKYFQNEMTNIESKYLAIKILENSASPDLFSSVVDNLMKTERNFILQKGQSTAYLERERYEREQNMKLISILEGVSLKNK
ncbi:hypothetical protein ACRUP2_000366 [Yersinia enterocolitica]